jgi:acyl-CoA synthetase (AMP-forming)/AMP-acid ligase II
MLSSPRQASRMQPNQRRTMAEVARFWAETQPDRTAYIFLKDGGTESERLTFAELDSRASSIAAELRRLKVSEGQSVPLIYPTCSDFVTALLGCFYAGATAVPRGG